MFAALSDGTRALAPSRSRFVVDLTSRTVTNQMKGTLLNECFLGEEFYSRHKIMQIRTNLLFLLREELEDTMSSEGVDSSGIKCIIFQKHIPYSINIRMIRPCLYGHSRF